MDPPTVPPDVIALWTAGLAVVTMLVTQGLKQLITPIHTAPDWAKAGVALVVALGASALGKLIGAPLPADLTGAVGVVVAWLGAMGVHALAKKLGVVKESVAA